MDLTALHHFARRDSQGTSDPGSNRSSPATPDSPPEHLAKVLLLPRRDRTHPRLPSGGMRPLATSIRAS